MSEAPVQRSVHLTEEEFAALYTLVPNHIDPDASWPGENEVGRRFETSGPELEYVRGQDERFVWTLLGVDGEDDLWLSSGMYRLNPLGYFVSTTPAPAGDLVFVRISMDPDEVLSAGGRRGEEGPRDCQAGVQDSGPPSEGEQRLVSRPETTRVEAASPEEAEGLAPLSATRHPMTWRGGDLAHAKERAMTAHERNYRLLQELLGGEEYRTIGSPSSVPLVVEKHDARPLVALYQYSEVKGELILGPKVVFLVEGGTARPVYFQSDHVNVRCATVEGYFEGAPVVPRAQRRLDTFSQNWLRTLGRQGFFAVARELNARQAARLAGAFDEPVLEADPEADCGPDMGP